MKTWVVVADAARARFFSVEENPGAHEGSQFAPSGAVPAGALVEFKDLSHPDSLKKASEMASDAPGMSSVSGMHSKFGMDEKVTPKEEEAIRFAKEIAEHLKHEIASYDRLYVVTPPHFLGLLRADLDKAVHDKVVGELRKELTHFPAEQIRDHLPAQL
ncbi:MAG: host attachment protein [Halothiobacillaceae bacterium]|nr:MAG: host attachment protein [Halothiobacillaceae bacterium]